METKELKITIPDGQEIDWQESAKQEKIVFKKKNTKPRSWEEYLELNTGFDGTGIDWNCGGVQTTGLHHRGKAIVPTKYGAPFIAMMQVMSVREDWIGDWKPNYYMNMASNWGIEYEPNLGVFSIENHCRTNGGGLTFPTREMAIDFMNTFKDLLEIAKPLI